MSVCLCARVVCVCVCVYVRARVCAWCLYDRDYGGMMGGIMKRIMVWYDGMMMG